MEVANLAELASGLKLNARGTEIVQIGDLSGGVSRFSKHPRWEIHPESDEFLYVIDGVLRLTLYGAEPPVERVLEAGQSCVVPADTWHSPIPEGTVSLLSLAQYAGTRVSDAVDPEA